jgi:ligand-binding sensor domain-containing protein
VYKWQESMGRQITILFLFWCTTAFSQQGLHYNFRHIDQSNGLLHNAVHSITQDKQGFIWIGTEKGLQRFDGLRFINYQPEFSNANNTHTSPINLYADNHCLWLSANSQLKNLGFFTNKITGYDKEQMIESSSFKYDSYTDWNNAKWLINDFAIYHYDSIGKQPVQHLINLPLKFSSTNVAKDESKKEIWVASWTLLFFDSKTKKIYSPEHNEIQHPLLQQIKGKPVFNVMEDSHHNIWISSWTYFLYKYDPVTKKLTSYSLKENHREDNKINNGILSINNVFEDNHANIWVATQNAGLLRYNSLHDNFDRIIDNEENTQGLQYNYNIYCIFQDKENNIWLGTDRGINIFNPYQNYIQSVQHENNDASLPKNEILGLIQNNK